LLCHSKYGGAEPEMSIAGTVYATRDPVPDPNDPTKTIPSPPVGGVQVVLYDADNTTPKKRVLTNCAGNFFVTTEEYSADPSIATWNPAFPVYAEVQFTLKHSSGNTAEDQLKRSAMGTWIQRDGSCSTCHNGTPNQGSAGRIFCLETTPPEPFLPFDVPTALTCPGGVPQ
jgi:hypothetical protein